MSLKNINNALLISICILRDFSQEKNLRVLFWGALPISHVPMETFLFYKKIKRELIM
jgi:hypothetical protein